MSGDWQHPISTFALIDPSKPSEITSTSDKDRCAHYQAFPTGVYTSQYEISIKWE